MKRLALCLVLVACGADLPTPTVTVTRSDLRVEVETRGTLAALESVYLSPPSSPGMWNFNIVRMAPEGSEVKKGDVALVLDGSELERRLVDRRSELDVAVKEIARKREELALAHRDNELKVAEAEAALRKAELKADLPPRYTSAVAMKLAQLDVEAARAELKGAQDRLTYADQLGKADLNFLGEKRARAETRLSEVQSALDSLTVKSSINGLAIYRTDWRGVKKKVGDPCWATEGCLEVADVSKLKASGEVDEMDAARVSVGQVVRLHLEAHPEREWRGKITEIGRSVYRQSPKTPLKVVHIDIELDELDPIAMRPAMQFRGVVEIEKKANVVITPMNTIFHRPSGPVVFRKTTTGFEMVPVKLGANGKTNVEVLAGLRPDDEVATADMGSQAP